MQDLKSGDIILIKGFKDPANVNFYCHMHFKDLIGLPTRVSVAFNSFYVSHPNLDSVPLNECVEFDILESTDEISHQEFKSKQKLYQQMMGGQPKPIKNLDKLKNFFLKKNINESDVESLTPKQKKLINLVDKLENGELSLNDLNNLIGGTELLIKKMNEEGIISYINPFDDIWDDYRNDILYAFYMNDPSFIWKVVDEYLSNDVTKVGDDYYYDVSNWSDEFASLFNTGRNDIRESTISEILSGDYDMDMWDITDDEYRDVYDDLKPEKKQLVNDRIREDLKKMKTIDAISDLLEEISQEQGRDNVELTDEVINRLLDDEETMEYLINTGLPDIRSDLYSVYSGCYTGTLSNEWYDSLWGELEGFAIDTLKGRDDYSYKVKGYDGTEKVKYATRFKATNSIYRVVSDFIVSKKDSTYNEDTIVYHGNYMGLLNQLIDDGDYNSLNVPRLDDYPDSRKVSSCVNENIGDYF